MLYKWNLIGDGHFLPAPEGAPSLGLCPRFAPVYFALTWVPLKPPKCLLFISVTLSH